jgi:hypothetical protein
MDRKSTARARIEAITELAERQHGVIARAQLYSLGLSETQVATRAPDRRAAIAREPGCTALHRPMPKKRRE